jgi:hypothetical protein
LTDDLINKYLGFSEGTIEKLKALRIFGEVEDERPLKAFNELMMNKHTQKFFGTLADYFFGEEVIEKLKLLFAANEARVLTLNDKLTKLPKSKGIPKRMVYLESGTTTSVITIKGLNERLTRANLMGIQEMLVRAKKEVEERDDK